MEQPSATCTRIRRTGWWRGGGACAASFSFTALNAAGAALADPIAANSGDQVVGNTVAAFKPTIGFVWSAGELTLVDGTSVLDAINDGGIAVGAADSGAAYASYDTKTATLTDVPIQFCYKGGHSECWAFGINNAGEVVGAADGGDKGVGFSWVNGVAQKVLPPHEKQSEARAINKRGDILVVRGDAFLDRNGKFTQISFPGAVGTNPSFLTDKDAVGGNYGTDSSAFGFVLSSGTYTSYIPAGSTSSTVVGIGPAGQIFGTFVDATGNTHGFENVSGIYYQIDVPNSTYTSIAGVSTSGMIFGVYTDSQGSYGYVGKCKKTKVCTQ